MRINNNGSLSDSTYSSYKTRWIKTKREVNALLEWYKQENEKLQQRAQQGEISFKEAKALLTKTFQQSKLPDLLVKLQELEDRFKAAEREQPILPEEKATKSRAEVKEEKAQEMMAKALSTQHDAVTQKLEELLQQMQKGDVL